jgi:hypothetical protein
MSPTPNNQEINQALKEYETKGETSPAVSGVITPKTNQSPAKQVEGVSFDTDKDLESYKAIKIYNETATPKIVKAVMKYSKGNQRQAEWILLTFVVVAMGISAFLFFKNTIHLSPPTTTNDSPFSAPPK